MAEPEKNQQQSLERRTDNWIKVFKNGLGGIVLSGLLYIHFFVRPVEVWMWGIPGLLLGYDPKAILDALTKR